MAGNSFGQVFKITSFGESHGKAIGVVVDGCPAGLKIDEEDIQSELDKRRPGQSNMTTKRDEKDKIEILSGVFEGKTLGSPIAMIVWNKNHFTEDYEAIKDIYRPGHADFSYDAKYGFRDWRGGGRSSARETLARVAAGAIAKKLLKQVAKVKIVGYVLSVGKVQGTKIVESFIEKNPLRCADPGSLEAMMLEVETARKALDSVGGVIEIRVKNVPAGLGEPVFHKLSADLAAAIMSIPAVKGFEIGDGFGAANRLGSENNDQFGKTNHAGGILGGISTGSDIVLRFALKPPSSIAKEQDTIDNKGRARKISVTGRHDPCVCPRAVPIAESMVALVLADHYLLNLTSKI